MKIIDKRTGPKLALINTSIWRVDQKILSFKSKFLYQSLCLLADSGKTTFPNYRFLAESVGFYPEGLEDQVEKESKAFVVKWAKPLIKMSLLEIRGNEFEVWDYAPEEN